MVKPKNTADKSNNQVFDLALPLILKCPGGSCRPPPSHRSRAIECPVRARCQHCLSKVVKQGKTPSVTGNYLLSVQLGGADRLQYFFVRLSFAVWGGHTCFIVYLLFVSGKLDVVAPLITYMLPWLTPPLCKINGSANLNYLMRLLRNKSCYFKKNSDFDGWMPSVTFSASHP